MQYNVVESNERISVCYAANGKIFGGIVLSVLSVLERTPRAITFYLLTMDLTAQNERFTPISEGQAEKLDKIVKTYNPENSVVLIDETELFMRELSKSKNLKNGFTPYAFIRLLLDLNDVPQKLLYLDVDTMCCSDLSQLFDIDVSGYEFAAVHDKVGRFWVRYDYCNSGVLLLNFENIKKSGLFIKARKRVNKRRMFMPDQSALNFLVKRKLILPYKFNEQRTIKPDTVIKHFCQGFKWYGPFFRLYNYKQWNRKEVHEKLGIHEFDGVYAKYDELDKIYCFDKA